MSDGAPRQGLAARLLHRAEGRVTALRPQIASTFSADAAQEAPRLERTEEVAATPPVSPRHAPDLPAAAAPPQSRAGPELFRLMPGEPPHVQPAISRPDTARPASDPEIEADGRAPTDSALPAAAARAAASLSLKRGKRAPRFEERRADSLSAAVMQLLGPQVAGTYPGAPTPEPPPTPDAFATTGFAVPVATVPAATMESAAAAPTEQAALQIHIGELVIAPAPRAPVHEAAPRAAWEPPLSLADYRASRSRERR
jgi:hypothetical protein